MNNQNKLLLVSFLCSFFTISILASESSLPVDQKIPKKYYGYLQGDLKEDAMLRAICLKNAERRLQNCHNIQDIPVCDEDEAWFAESVKQHQKLPHASK